MIDKDMVVYGDMDFTVHMSLFPATWLWVV